MQPLKGQTLKQRQIALIFFHVSCLVLRFLVECRYLPSPVLSVSYMVKTPSLGPAIHTQGVFGVQLRIAKGTVACANRLAQLTNSNFVLLCL